jgi:uncharacterized protein YjiS (DUF1127 family)
MALVDFAAAPSAVSPFATTVRAVGDWLARRRAAREQQLAMQSLLFMPQHRLDDLGISRDQLIAAMEIHRK